MPSFLSSRHSKVHLTLVLDMELEHELVELLGVLALLDDLEVSNKLAKCPLDCAGDADDVTVVGGASEHLMANSEELLLDEEIEVEVEEVLEVATVEREGEGEERGGVGGGAYWIQEELGEGEPPSPEEGAVDVTETRKTDRQVVNEMIQLVRD
jgi:hypothetical protein